MGKVYKCDACGGTPDSRKSQFPEEWFTVTLSRGNNGADYEFELCDACVPLPIKASRLTELVKGLVSKIWGVR